MGLYYFVRWVRPEGFTVLMTVLGDEGRNKKFESLKKYIIFINGKFVPDTNLIRLIK